MYFLTAMHASTQKECMYGCLEIRVPRQNKLTPSKGSADLKHSIEESFREIYLVTLGQPL